MSERTDVSVKATADREGLLRWFVGPDGEPWPDWTGRARVPGRCVYTGPDAESIAATVSNRGFSRGWKGNVKVPSVDVLTARARDLGLTCWRQRLGLAHRAGALSVGQAAARDNTSGAAMLLATDAGEAAQSRFASNAGRKQMPLIRTSGETLGSALGREFVSVVIISRSPFAESLTAWATALSTYPESGIMLDSRGERRLTVVSEAQTMYERDADSVKPKQS